MAQKYTILKVLIQDSSKVQNSDKGFTLIELIFGLLIMVLVGGFAMNALIEASNTFNKNKKDIDSSQNLSAILEIIGNDIKQSGEQINDAKFPVVTIENPGTATTVMPGSSKITIHRAFVSSLTLCEAISSTSSNTTLLVADNSITTTTANCNVGTTGSTTTPTVVTRPTTLREARDYRCKLDDVNADYSSTTSDFCNGSTTAETVLAAISDLNGNMRSFRYINDSYAGSTASITISPSLLNAQTVSAPNATASYAAGSPLYLIERRVYTLDNNGNFQVKIDDKDPQTLIKGIQQFKVSAKIYDGTTNSTISTTPPNPCASNTTYSYYSCTYSAASTMIGTTATSSYNWKNIAGVKVELEAKYDATGRAATSSTNPTDIAQVTNDKEKLKAQAEFFPRNVLSK